MYKVNIENGYYLFKLDDILKEKGISINQLMRDTNTDFKVIKRLTTGNLVEIDIFVVARICNYLNCTLGDIIDYKRYIKPLLNVFIYLFSNIFL